MSIEVRVTANSDNATIVWRPDRHIAGCRGFALHRNAKDAQGQVTPSVVATWVGFAGGPATAPGEHHPSNEWPIQRCLWSDYFAGGTAAVQYRIVPMLGTAGHLQPAPDPDCSSWSPWVTVG